jgi:hypothetical protein
MSIFLELERLGHLPTRTERRDTLRLECLLVHHHHFLPGHTLLVKPAFSTTGSSSSSSFFALPFPADDPHLPLALLPFFFNGQAIY